MADRCLAVIPARGGSKRVPGKNIRALLGEPAIAYTIRAAVDSGLFERVVVSTDSAAIAAVALENGADVPFVRQASLADDETPVSAVTVDALERLDPDGAEFGFIAQLMPNCPLRTAADVRDSHAQFERTAAPSQLSVTRFGWQNPWWAMRRAPDMALEPLFVHEVTRRSQDLPELFCPTGVIWWATAGTLRTARTFHVPGRTGWEIPWQRAVDIDTEDDWQMAEALLRLSREVGVAHD
jgi:CMP-N-acetylneuraminic acid synthetase